ncbi:hypothetical protein [Segetibacter koreensis]|uniref:hypothetical protein n=1 Tax=Segetibacter koreensis TaxID=398037 RepID=UPI000381F3C8|nr:hypothetical protein [Segetibacter koreensis]
MKKLVTSAVLTLLIAASSFAAGENKVNSKAASNFLLEFKDAKNVNWKSTENYVKVSFILNDKNMDAFYDLDGNKIATSSNIAMDKLPTSAKRAFAKKFADYTFKEAIQFDGVEDTAYYISAENEAQSLLLKVSAEGFVSVLKNVRK